jgi:hypothetical protein
VGKGDTTMFWKDVWILAPYNSFTHICSLLQGSQIAQLVASSAYSQIMDDYFSYLFP